MKFLNTKSLSGVTAMVATLALVLGLSACGSTPEEKAEHITDRISSKLDLNETQQALLQVLKDDALVAAKNMKENKTQMKTEFIELMGQQSIDESQLTQFMDQATLALTTNITGATPSFIAFHASLNDEQRAQIVNFMNKHNHHHGHD